MLRAVPSLRKPDLGTPSLEVRHLRAWPNPPLPQPEGWALLSGSLAGSLLCGHPSANDAKAPQHGSLHRINHLLPFPGLDPWHPTKQGRGFWPGASHSDHSGMKVPCLGLKSGLSRPWSKQASLLFELGKEPPLAVSPN